MCGNEATKLAGAMKARVPMPIPVGTANAKSSHESSSHHSQHMVL